MDSDIFYINVPHPNKNLASHIPNTITQTSHILNISQWEHPTSATFHIHRICHPKHLTLRTYILCPHPEHRTSQISQIPKVQHLQHPTFPTSDIPNIPHPQYRTSLTSRLPNILYTQHLTSATSLIPNNPQTQDTTS